MKHYLRGIIAADMIMLTLSAFAAEPVAPMGVKAEDTPEGVVITWQPVTEDIDENAIDPKEVIYDVYRCDSSDGKELVGADIAATTYTDVLGEIAGEIFYRWQVVAKTTDGSSSQDDGYSELLSFGDGTPLPYFDTFNTAEGWGLKPDNHWTSESAAGYYEFDVEKELFFDNGDDYVYIYGADYTEGVDDGFLCFEPSKWSDADTFYTSGNINLGDAESPVVSFYIHIIPGAHNSYQINVIDAKGTTHEIVNATPDGDTFGWKETDAISLKDFKGQKIRLQIHASYYPDSAPATGVRAPICIDNIKVENSKIQTGISNIDTDIEARTTYYGIDGRHLVNPAPGQFVIKIERRADGTVNITKTIIR